MLAGTDGPLDPALSRRERACLALADQFVVSVADVTDELTDAVLEHLDPGGLYALVCALYLFDARARLELALGGIFGE